MERTLMIALLLLVGCSGGDDPADNSADNAADNSAANSSTVLNSTADRPDLVETDDCLATVSRRMVLNSEISYTEATEAELGSARSDYNSWCSAQMAIDWDAVLSSTGFDDDDEITMPGAVAAAVLPFLAGAQAYCEGSAEGSLYRANVGAVVLTATDQPARVGLCLDTATKTLVGRFMLDPDANTATALDAAETTTWLTDNLQ